MNFWGLLAACLLNVIVAVGYFKQNNWGMVMVFTAYAFSTIGFMISK